MWKYYIQIPIIPIYYLLALTKNIYKAIKRAFNFTYWETRDVWRSHKRCYKK